MNTKEVFLKRVNECIELANVTLASVGTNDFELNKTRFRTQSLKFVEALNGKSDTNYVEFERASRFNSGLVVANCKAILEGIRHDIANDYYVSNLQGLLSAEIFGDFLDMAEYLLTQDYHVPAAVITGSTLEEHLRKLCRKNVLPLEVIDTTGKVHLKTGKDFNTDLYKAGVYNKIEMGLVEGWIKIRNAAAHGNHSEYTKDQVSHMLQGVKEFIGRNLL